MGKNSLFGLFVVLGALLVAQVVEAAPRGVFKKTNAFCSNPHARLRDYEREYLRALREMYACRPGPHLKSVCFEQFYTFGKGASMEVAHRYSDSSGATCTLKASGRFRNLDQPGYGRFDISGRTTYKMTGSSAALEGICRPGAGIDTGLDPVLIQYKMKNGKFLYADWRDGRPGSVLNCGVFYTELSPVRFSP